MASEFNSVYHAVRVCQKRGSIIIRGGNMYMRVAEPLWSEIESFAYDYFHNAGIVGDYALAGDYRQIRFSI